MSNPLAIDNTFSVKLLIRVHHIVQSKIVICIDVMAYENNDTGDDIRGYN